MNILIILTQTEDISIKTCAQFQPLSYLFCAILLSLVSNQSYEKTEAFELHKNLIVEVHLNGTNFRAY